MHGPTDFGFYTRRPLNCLFNAPSDVFALWLYVTKMDNLAFVFDKQFTPFGHKINFKQHLLSTLTPTG